MSCGWQAFTHCCSGSRSCGSSRHMQVPWTPTAGSSSQGGPAPSGEPSGGGKSETPSRFSGCSVHGFSSRGSAAFRGTEEEIEMAPLNRDHQRTPSATGSA
ncbi:hypothetical protein RvY_08237-2 [Ramazzottius varieornatus]|uniref:Uncharacterized protein n=1 Tax=Ramazzottius varieornatus TaxID=947166 RepID=A0A1D1V9X4_RAMVA|nr:hypothetical protein RvY_08237-2 [Ramazzottius varieornatus]